MRAVNIFLWGISMNTYVYSAKNNAFFPVELIERYELNGWDLSDAVDVDDLMANQYIGDAPAGKVRVAGENGLPAWGDIPPLSHEEEVKNANDQKESLIEQANVYINSKQWPGKAAIGRLKGEELAQYNLWLDYLDALELVDTSSAPDIEWPLPPQ